MKMIEENDEDKIYPLENVYITMENLMFLFWKTYEPTGHVQ